MNKQKQKIIDFYIKHKEINEIVNKLSNKEIKKINKLYKKSFNDKKINSKKVSPILKVNAKKINANYNDYGKILVNSKKLGIVIFSGGNASRMKCKIPKGCIKFDNTTLFKKIFMQLNNNIKIFIQTNKDNNNYIKNYLEKENYFGINKNNVFIFIQGELPILDINGNILLKNKKSILTGPNGNGDVFNALKNEKYIKIIKKLKYIEFISIDNLNVNVLDYKFLGYIFKNNYSGASKTILKNKDDNKTWVFCNYKKRPYLLKTEEKTDKIKKSSYYQDINISYHILSAKSVLKNMKRKVSYHRAYKEYSYLNSKLKKETKYCFKFEKFIFDYFKYEKKFIIYKVENDEFYPIKTYNDFKKNNL